MQNGLMPLKASIPPRKNKLTGRGCQADFSLFRFDFRDKLEKKRPDLLFRIKSRILSDKTLNQAFHYLANMTDTYSNEWKSFILSATGVTMVQDSAGHSGIKKIADRRLSLTRRGKALVDFVLRNPRKARFMKPKTWPGFVKPVNPRKRHFVQPGKDGRNTVLKV